METQKLYYEDAYLREFTAKVTAVSEKDGSILIALDRTAFYPEGGGQNADSGKLILKDGTELFVADVHEKDEDVWHVIKDVPEGVRPGLGEEVSGIIDWDRRFDHMQQHSGEHIVSGLICRTFNCDNVGFHMGTEAVTIDYNARISYEDALKIEEMANRYIWEDHEFVEMWPTPEELKELDYRSKKELTGKVRITSFPGADMCACCGTHVKRSSEVGLVKLVSAHNFHEGTRLELYSGKRALDFLSVNHRENKAVAVLLSTKEDKTSAVVKKQIEDFAELKGRMTLIEDKYFAMWAESLEESENVLVISDELDPEQGRRFADMAADHCKGIVAVLCKGRAEGSETYRYSLISRNADVSALNKEMNLALNGRGGGRGGFAQGTIPEGREKIREFFASKEIFES